MAMTMKKRKTLLFSLIILALAVIPVIASVSKNFGVPNKEFQHQVAKHYADLISTNYVREELVTVAIVDFASYNKAKLKYELGKKTIDEDGLEVWPLYISYNQVAFIQETEYSKPVKVEARIFRDSGGQFKYYAESPYYLKVNMR